MLLIVQARVRRRRPFEWRLATRPFLKTPAALAMALSMSGCVTVQPPYPNVAPIDTSGNYGAR